ncbi:MAG: hypothetical protein OXR66_07895 [Candidatus Woesearchaeota archaeon]|nr:hypothetical protein [Candidatus Woesearchaeota archaeon]
MTSLENYEEIMALQRQMASRVVQENEMDLQLKLLDIINDLVKNKQQQVQKAKVFTIAEMEGIADEQCARLLQSLDDLGYIRIVGAYVKRA